MELFIGRGAGQSPTRIIMGETSHASMTCRGETGDPYFSFVGWAVPTFLLNSRNHMVGMAHPTPAGTICRRLWQG